MDFPPHVRALLRDGPIVDLETSSGPMIVDATWPLSRTGLGLPVNEEFVWGQDMTIACVPIHHRPIPAEGDPQAIKEALLRQSCDRQALARRDAFVEALSTYRQEARESPNS